MWTIEALVAGGMPLGTRTEKAEVTRHEDKTPARWRVKCGHLVVIGMAAPYLTGCPAGADLDDADMLFEALPSDFSDGRACDATVVFEQRCGLGAGCHETAESGTPPLGGVDLVAPDVAKRLVDVPATFPSAPECEGAFALLVDSQSLDDSYLWKKVNNTHGECGDGIPTPYFEATALSQSDLACVRSWVSSLTTMDAGEPEMPAP